MAYYRVSTGRQGESALGLEAQRTAVAKFMHAAFLLSKFQEIESGKRHTNRPQLDAALDSGSPWENGYCESFNLNMRDEFLNGEIFYSMKELRVLAERWHKSNNTARMT